ncbi:MAG TPA: phasin family protein, partial [Stellaceae bacterium]|nr:phasin family protein [Stellaceae bacterium]
MPISEPEAVIPEEIAPPAPEEPAAAERDAASRDSLTALAMAEEALAHVPEPAGAPAAPQPAAPPASDLCALGRDSLAALAAAQAALVRGCEAVGGEIVGLARLGLETASRTATGLLAARTLSEAVALQADYARNSLDAAVAASARLSKLGVG